MNFEELCKNKVFSLDPKKVLVEFFKYNPDILSDIFKNREDIYKELLEIILSTRENESNINCFIGWFRDYLYNY